jgi:hypothetical protein
VYFCVSRQVAQFGFWNEFSGINSQLDFCICGSRLLFFVGSGVYGFVVVGIDRIRGEV